MSYGGKSSFSTHYVTGDKRTSLYAHLCSVCNIWNSSEESKAQRLSWEYQVDKLLNMAQDTRLGMPRFRLENDISIPNQITVFQNDEIKRIIIVVHGCYNISLQKDMLNAKALEGALIRLCDELGPGKKNEIIKRAKTFEKTVDQLQNIMVDRSKLFPEHSYTFLGHSFGAMQLYYAILRSNHIARNVTSAHLFNPVTAPLIGLTFRRKIHPDVMRRINIHKVPQDTLSHSIQYLFGIHHIYQCFGRAQKWMLQPCNIKSKYAIGRVTWGSTTNVLNYHDLSNFI